MATDLEEMSARVDWRFANRLAAVPAAGFRVAVVAALLSLAASVAVDAQGKSDGRGNSDSSQGSSNSNSGSPGNSGNSPSRSDGTSPGNSGNAPGQTGNTPGQGAPPPGAAGTSPPLGLTQSDALDAVREDEIYSLKVLLPRVTGRYGGKVIDVSLWQEGDRLTYKFKLRTDNGSVRTIRMDARTGRFLGFGAWFR